METGRRFGTAGFLPIVAKGGVSHASSNDRTASSRLPSDTEKLSRAAVIGSQSRRRVTISDSTVCKLRRHAKRKLNKKETDFKKKVLCSEFIVLIIRTDLYIIIKETFFFEVS